MKKFYVLLILLLFAGSTLSAREANRFVAVTGTATLKVPADQVEWRICIKTIHPSLKESQKKNNSNLEALLKMLSSAGITNKDIEVSPIEQGKHYEYLNQKSIQKGFYTQVYVHFYLKKLSEYTNLTRQFSLYPAFEIKYSAYQISENESYQQKTLKNALLAAQKKAGYLAETLGVKLGKVLEIQEDFPTYHYTPSQLSNDTRQIPGNPADVFGVVIITKSINVKFLLK